MAVSRIEDLYGLVGQDVAVSDWLLITQERIRAFAEATDDLQWIHVDSERAQRESPFGTTIAHGFLTLSLLPRFMYETVDLRAACAMTVNYGCNRVRFMNPVPSGASIRARFHLLELTEFNGGHQAVWRVTVELQGHDKPACVAETVMRYYSGAA